MIQTALTLVALACLVGWLNRLRRGYLVVTVRGPSMTPTYRHGDRLLVRRCRGSRIRAGEVAVVDLPEWIRPVPGELGPREALRARRVIKRVAAIPGDPVPLPFEGAGAVVPPASLVLLGDNPDGSGDSRQYGYVPTDAVVGVVLRPLRDRS